MELNMRYTKIYKFMEIQLMLGGNDLRLFALIYSFHEAGKSCFASIQKLTKQLTSSRRSIIRSIDALQQMGIINVSKYDAGGKLLDLSVNEAGIYRRAEELARSAEAKAAEDEDDEEDGEGGSADGDGDVFERKYAEALASEEAPPTGTYGDNHAHGEGARSGEGAYESNCSYAQGEGAQGGGIAYGSNSKYARGGAGQSSGDKNPVPRYTARMAQEALYHALCRTYGAENVRWEDCL